MEAVNCSDVRLDPNPCYLHKFRLYETRSNFYMVGRDKNRTIWKILKIDRSDTSELNILEDPTTYSEIECCDLLRRIHEGNMSTGGLKLVTACYGIIGFVKFLGPYYMLLITKRRKIGVICGNTIYALTKSEMITVPHSHVQSNMACSKNEKRYKKLLSTVDLTKDFFFSYSYNIMHSLQRNLYKNETGLLPHYESMFVWNAFLTQGIRNNLKNTLWTVALVYGFFKQIKLSVSDRDVKLTLIARRSRHYAGTRYLKRGVNEKGRVANDVETEQIVFEDVLEGCPTQISSVVQNRGSIPLVWTQETSRLNLKPDITLSKKDPYYDATKLHFENLVRRYGNPIIILNLIKKFEKKPRETILHAEFAKAIGFINKSLTKENRLRFFHWDLTSHSKKSTNALELLGKLADYALNLTGIFYCQLTPNHRPEGLLNLTCIVRNDEHCAQIPSEESDSGEKLEVGVGSDKHDSTENIKPPMFQSGVLRTNCIDCLDRTNVAQYSYGLTALGRQLHVMGFTESQIIDQNSPLVGDLMEVYEKMGDTLAMQYGGSAAHNKIFCQRRGQWHAATQSQELLRSLQRYYSNAYMDAEKQNAINLFLGHFHPQQDRPALWELDSDQHCSIGRHCPSLLNEDARPSIKRSMSEGNIFCGTDSPMGASNVKHHESLSENRDEATHGDISYSRFAPRMSCRQLFGDMQDQPLGSNHECFENGDECNCTNFDMDWLSSSGNSCDGDIYDRSATCLSSEIIGAELKTDTTTSPSTSDSSIKGLNRSASNVTRDGIPVGFSESFMKWVTHGYLLNPIKFACK